MLSIGKLAPGPDAATYYTQRVGCPLDYFVGRGEAAGVWLGRGSVALGLHGSLDGPDAEQVLRYLLAGRDPDGALLVKPVLRADPRSHVPTLDVVRALTREANDRDRGRNGPRRAGCVTASRARCGTGTSVSTCGSLAWT